MKKLAILLVFALCFSGFGAFAESQLSSADRFLNGLGEAWDAFLGMAGEAVDSAAGWLGSVSVDVQQFFDENVPQWQEWLNSIGQYVDENVPSEIREDWSLLIEAAAKLGAHTKEEVAKAYAELEAWLEESGAGEAALNALKQFAGLAGVEPQE